ncbi:MAG: EamA family transporter [Alphaproteobacteria bacterium]|nr:EamA family transporter [Alphaproteobacteria bacterium]
MSTEPSRNSTLTGVALACTSTALGGMTLALTRFIIADTDALTLAFLRYGLGTLALFAVLMWRSGWPKFERRDWLALVLLGFTMFTVFPYFMTQAMADTTAARGGLLFATMPVMAIILGTAFGVERFTASKGLGVFLALTGTIIALGEGVDAVAPDALRGDLHMFTALVAATIFNVFAKRYILKYGSLAVMTTTGAVGVFGLLVLALTFGRPFSGSLDFDLVGWVVVLFLAIPGAAVMVGLWGWALKLITPTQATITVGMNPITAILLGAVLLSEPMTTRVLIGFALVLAAIAVAAYGPEFRRAPATSS